LIISNVTKSKSITYDFCVRFLTIHHIDLPSLKRVFQKAIRKNDILPLKTKSELKVTNPYFLGKWDQFQKLIMLITLWIRSKRNFQKCHLRTVFWTTISCNW